MTAANRSKTQGKRLWRTPEEVAEAEESAKAFTEWLAKAFMWKPAYIKTDRESQAWLHGLFFGLAAKITANHTSKGK